MADTIKYNGKSLKYKKSAVTVNTVTFDDGTVVSITGPVTNAIALAAYTANKAEAASPPTVIVKPSPGEPTLIGNKELAVLSDVDSEKFVLKPGIYTDRSDWKNLKDVGIEGNGKVSFQTGQRAIQMNGGKFSGITLSGLNLKDINDDVISVWGSGDYLYDGSAGSFVDGITLQNIVAENCGTLFHMDGGIRSGKHYGVIKNFKMAGSKFINSPNPGMAVYLGNAEGYDISGNIVNNINYQYPDPAWPNGYHNGIFMLNGNGKFYNNSITNHQGNAIRAWLHSIGDTKMVEIFNNIVWNSRKYSAFELQVTPEMRDNGYKPANARVYSNIVGKMNNSHDWEGQELDLYNTGGTLEYFDNIAFELNRVSGAITDGINNMSDTKIIRNTGNKYYATESLAISENTTLKALFAGIEAYK